MSDDSVHHGDKPSLCSGSSQRVLLSQQQLDSIALESLRSAWKSQDLYIDHLESQNKHFEGSLERAKETEERIKQQYGESQHRERVLVRRLAAKEQEIQDYMSQITELKSAQASLAGRPTLLDPAVNILILRLKQELAATRARLEETQNELSAWKFTPDSNTGKKLMAKCRLLHQENEDLGRMTSSGRIAKLEGDLALQKSFSEEVKKSQSELDEFLQELDEDVEGMQSTVLFLQQELRAAKERPTTPGSGVRAIHRQMNGDTHSRNGDDTDQVSADVAPDPCVDNRTHFKGKSSRDHKRTNTSSGELGNLKREFGSESESECSVEDGSGGVKKRRRASVLSLDYNEEDDPLTVTNGDAE